MSTESKKYFRLEPVDLKKKVEGRVVDVKELLLFLKSKYLFIVKATILSSIIGVLISLGFKNEFTSNIQILPETADGGGISDLLGTYGGLIGIDGSAGRTSGLGTRTYPSILNSLSFNLELLQDTIQFRNGKKQVLIDYFENKYSPSIYQSFIEFLVNIQKNAKSLFVAKELNEISDDRFLSLTESEFRWVEELRERIDIKDNDDSGIITIQCIMRDPVSSAVLCKCVSSRLQNKLTLFVTQKEQDNFNFIHEQREAAKVRLEETQNNLVSFSSANKNVQSEYVIYKLKNLKMNMT